MFFVIAKLLWFVAAPSHIAIALVCLGAILLWTRWRRAGRGLASAGAVVLFAIGFLPLSAVLVAPLEDRFGVPAFQAAPTGIIVLGGSVDEYIEEAREQVTLTEAAQRLTTGAALLRQFPGARLVFTGGSASLTGSYLSEANSVRRLWTELGVPQGKVVYEDQSRNTYENALLSRNVVQPKPGEIWLLVTSAMHMPRSIGVFRKAGFDVTAYPTDYRTRGHWRDWLPSPDASRSIRNIDAAAHEWLGLFGYWLTGKIDALLPG